MADYNIQAEGLKIENPDILGDVTIRPVGGESVVLSSPTENGTIARAEDLIGKADLGMDGKLVPSQYPAGFSPVNDILLGTYVDPTTFNDPDNDPYTPDNTKLYVDTITGKIYWWTGVAFSEPPSSLTLGSTSNTAHRGDHGAEAYAHTILTNNPHGVTKAQVGLGNVDDTSDTSKPISTATQTALDLKANNKTTIVEISGNHTLVLGNKDKTLESVSATPVDFTIPANVFESGDLIFFTQIGTGQLSFVAGSGLTLRSADGEKQLRKQNSQAYIYFRTPTDCVLAGDLTHAL